MSLVITYDNYAQWVESVDAKSSFFELPETVQTNINSYFDGEELENRSDYNPVYFEDLLIIEEDREFITSKMNISGEEYETLLENDTLEEYIEEHLETMIDDTTFFGRESGVWYYIQ